MNSTRQKNLLVIAAFVVIGIVIILGLSANFDADEPLTAEKSRVPDQTREQLNGLSTALSQVAAAVSPSVVNIATTKRVERQGLPEGYYNHPFFRRFFEEPFTPEKRPRPFHRSALGSGVIVSENGHILTNNHVIEAAEEILVTLHDKRTFRAELLGADPKTDLALLKIDAVNLPPLVLKEEDDLQTGEIVIAVGIPFGLSHTVTMGIVSATGRSNVGIVDYEDFIQTDAAINPGNSGGALVNGNGELVGINTAIFSTSGGNMGVGFAIPAAMAKSVMDSLIEHGKVIRGWLGVAIQDITPELAEYFDLETTSGALITNVVEGGPAGEAGVEAEDIVIAFNGRPVETGTDLKNLVAAAEPGSSANLRLIRNGEEREIEVKLGELPAHAAITGKAPVENSESGLFFGASVQTVTPQLRARLNLPESAGGLLVTEVKPGSGAAGVLRRGDIISEINRIPVDSLSDVEDILRNHEAGATVLLLISRDGRELFATLKP